MNIHVLPGSNRNLVAMALSGFTDDKNTLWKEMCGPFSTQLHDPCLRAMFAFLVNGSGDYDAVLVLSHNLFIWFIVIQIIECSDIIHNEIRYTSMQHHYDLLDIVPVHTQLATISPLTHQQMVFLRHSHIMCIHTPHSHNATLENSCLSIFQKYSSTMISKVHYGVYVLIQ